MVNTPSGSDDQEAADAELQEIRAFIDDHILAPCGTGNFNILDFYLRESAGMLERNAVTDPQARRELLDECVRSLRTYGPSMPNQAVVADLETRFAALEAAEPPPLP